MAAQRAGLEQTKQISRHYRALYGACSEGREALGTRVNTDIIGCVWTGELDLNPLRVDGEIFEFGKKNISDSNISGYVWMGPLSRHQAQLLMKGTAPRATHVQDCFFQISLKFLFTGHI